MAAANVDLTLIQKAELFSSLPEREIEYIVSQAGTLKLPKGAILFSSGEKAKRFFILTSGVIRVYKKNEDNEDELARFTPGDTIGDFDFARGAEYDACAEADEDSEVIEFPRNGLTMESLAKEEPRTICSILLNGIIMMTGRIKSTRKLMLDKMSWAQDLHRRAYEDAGTGLWKQTLINDEILGTLKDPAALIMIKPDRFKILVDSRGHSAGDEAMIRIAIILKNITRNIALVPEGTSSEAPSSEAPSAEAAPEEAASEEVSPGAGWALRFKSNEVGLIVNNCGANQAEKIARELAEIISDMDPVPAQDDIPEFLFSATISWCIWPKDNADWDTLFKGNYASLLDNWRDGGERVIHYSGN
jgi:CRP-like cAMP-binding protein